MPDPRVIVKALIRLNCLENEFKVVSDRSLRKGELQSALETERAKVPVPILAHHNRIRARGRDSTAPVRDWVCRACFITVASGMRTHLAQRDDLHVCENCGSYSYVPDGTEEYPDDTQLLNAARARESKNEKKSLSGKVKAKAKIKPARKSVPKAKKAKKKAAARSTAKTRKAASHSSRGKKKKSPND
jgi:hypothetical protein